MTVSEFHHAAMTALDTAPNKEVLIELAKQGQELADMVGWANGIIDKDGRVSDAFLHLQERAKAQHKATGDQNVAILHDIVSELLAAIYLHDQDLTPSTVDNDDSV